MGRTQKNFFSTYIDLARAINEALVNNTFKLPSYTLFLWRNCLRAYVLLFHEFMFTLAFSMPLIFTLLQANSIPHFLTTSINFSCVNFFQQNSSPLF